MKRFLLFVLLCVGALLLLAVYPLYCLLTGAREIWEADIKPAWWRLRQ